MSVRVYICMYIYIDYMNAIGYYLRNLRVLDIFVQLSSSSNRRGCFCELSDKQANPKDSRFRVSTYSSNPRHFCSIKQFKQSMWLRL